MSTPWPDDVFDCALRLARSLGYEEIDVSHHKGRVYVFCAEQSDCFTEKISELYNTPVTPLWAIFDGDWRELDPRDPTVWGALIGPPGVKKLKYQSFDFFTVIYDGGKRGAPAIEADYVATCGDGLKGTHKDIGIAVCEAYNALKGNPRRGNE